MPVGPFQRCALTAAGLLDSGWNSFLGTVNQFAPARYNQRRRKPFHDGPLRNSNSTVYCTTMSKTNLIGHSLSQITDVVTSLGDRPYKGKQLYKWLYKFQQYDFEAMTDLSKGLRQGLTDKYVAENMRPEKTLISQDGTKKFLFRLSDGHPIEMVLMDMDEGKRTVCISSQAGCALACGFCATGTMGLLRDLTVGEIVGQLMYLREEFGSTAFSNIVMMGMGEPLNNFDNVVEALRIITDEPGLAVSPKKITVSTSGVTPKIKKLADTGMKLKLAVSLHAAIQFKRVKIMPVAETFGLEKLIEATRYYAEVTNSRITFEYILFKNFNNTMEDVKALEKLLRGIPCKINILAYNPVPGLDFERPTDEEVDWFGAQLQPRLPAVTVRKSRGLDIDAACGQLAARNIGG